MIILMAESSKKSLYGKRPLWQWIVLYAVVAVVVYGLIYVFVIAKKGGGYNYGSSSTPSTQSAPSTKGPSY